MLTYLYALLLLTAQASCFDVIAKIAEDARLPWSSRLLHRWAVDARGSTRFDHGDLQTHYFSADGTAVWFPAWTGAHRLTETGSEVCVDFDLKRASADAVYRCGSPRVHHVLVGQDLGLTHLARQAAPQIFTRDLRPVPLTPNDLAIEDIVVAGASEAFLLTKDGQIWRVALPSGEAQRVATPPAPVSAYPLRLYVNSAADRAVVAYGSEHWLTNLKTGQVDLRPGVMKGWLDETHYLVEAGYLTRMNDGGEAGVFRVRSGMPLDVKAAGGRVAVLATQSPFGRGRPSGIDVFRDGQLWKSVNFTPEKGVGKHLTLSSDGQLLAWTYDGKLALLSLELNRTVLWTPAEFYRFDHAEFNPRRPRELLVESHRVDDPRLTQGGPQAEIAIWEIAPR